MSHSSVGIRRGGRGQCTSRLGSLLLTEQSPVLLRRGGALSPSLSIGSKSKCVWWLFSLPKTSPCNLSALLKTCLPPPHLHHFSLNFLACVSSVLKLRNEINPPSPRTIYTTDIRHNVLVGWKPSRCHKTATTGLKQIPASPNNQRQRNTHIELVPPKRQRENIAHQIYM